jgi:cephalosporin hydroxylase
MWVFCLVLLLASLGLASMQCLDTPNGEAKLWIQNTAKDQIVCIIDNIEELSCICDTEFLGVQGAMLHADCGAMRFFTRQSVESWRALPLQPSGRPFTYVETGSYLGLSAHIVASTALALGVEAIVYSHDLFDQADEERGYDKELWGAAKQKRKTNLQLFYSNVRRNNFTRTIIPIAGPSAETLNIHEPESVDMIFIDGDHSYEGVLADLRESWRILRPGGMLLGHDCIPEEDAVFHEGMGLNGVRRAVKFFFLEVLQLSVAQDTVQGILTVNPWMYVKDTAHMFAIQKSL